MKRASSLRFIATPIACRGFDSTLIVISLEEGLRPKLRPDRLRLRCRRGGGCLLHGFDDVLIAGASAQIAGQLLANLGFRWIRLVLQEHVGAHHHAWRAEAALQAVTVPER